MRRYLILQAQSAQAHPLKTRVETVLVETRRLFLRPPTTNSGRRYISIMEDPDISEDQIALGNDIMTLAGFITEWTQHFGAFIATTRLGETPGTLKDYFRVILQVYGSHTQALSIVRPILAEATVAHQHYLAWLLKVYHKIYERAHALLAFPLYEPLEDLLPIAYRPGALQAFNKADMSIRDFLIRYFPSRRDQAQEALVKTTPHSCRCLNCTKFN